MKPNSDIAQREIAIQLQKRLRLVTRVFWITFIPFLALFLIFGLPVIGNYVVMKIGASAGCGGNASHATTCFLYGKDIGGIFYNYAITSLLGGIFNPVLFLSVLRLFVPGPVLMVWITTLIISAFGKWSISIGLKAHG